MPKVGMPNIRKPQLVQATMAVIDKVGLHAASISLISKEAGVSTGIVNHYFGGKRGLLHETMREVLRQLSTTVTERLSQLPKHGSLSGPILFTNLSSNASNVLMKSDFFPT